MEEPAKKAISTDAYKGVRDFYPPDMFVQTYIFRIMREVVESYGYIEYSASLLEPAELYKAKSGEEIVRDQTYSFTDRGDREVTLRPEMTPTVARMVAKNRRELALPLRWYSIPNLFRYEAPQRGRLREHWQLNVDLFGINALAADIEVITIADRIMKRFGAKSGSYNIRINNRRLMQTLYSYFELSEPESYAVSKIIDKNEKIPAAEFDRSLREILGDKTKILIDVLSTNSIESLVAALPKGLDLGTALTDIQIVISELLKRNVNAVCFSPTLMRGFDYYTGIVFEVFDTNPKNRRSLFGGGRYDDLLDIFGAEKVTAVGFGMGDVTIRDFIETYALLPEYFPTIDLYIAHAGGADASSIEKIADTLRSKGLRIAVDIGTKKVGDQIKTADREKIPYIMVVGEEEIKTGNFKLKELKTGTESALRLEEIVACIKK